MIDLDYIKENKLILFEVVSGSRAYGLDTATSDTDIRGVFYMPRNLFYGHEYTAQVSSDRNDIVYYELGRFVELLSKNNPTVLEMLATPDQFVRYKHPLMEQLKPEIFLSKMAKDTFAQYAFTQIKKAKGLNKKINNPMEDKRKTIIDFCFVLQEQESVPVLQWLRQTGRSAMHCGLSSIKSVKGMYALYYDERLSYKGIVQNDTTNEIVCSPIDAAATLVAYLFFNQDAYSTHCKNFREYQKWITMRNDQRYQSTQKHGQGYDAKNMMHTIRLLQVAQELIETGILNVYRKNREELLAIKNGTYPYETVLEKATALMNCIEQKVSQSALPDYPDKTRIQNLLVMIREALYQP
jgi:hypothetical protein